MKVSIVEVERIRKGSRKGLNLTVREDLKSETTLESLKSALDSNGNKKYVHIEILKKEEDEE